MALAADMGRHSGRATPSLHDGPYQQFNTATGRRSTYLPHRWGIIAHLEIRSIEPPRAPLPITETGYLSHFHQCGTVEAMGGGVVAQVRAWLDEEAAKPDWLLRVEASRQGELF